MKFAAFRVWYCARMSEDERDIDVELDDGDGDLGGMDDDGNSIIGEDGIPENKRCAGQERLS